MRTQDEAVVEIDAFGSSSGQFRVVEHPAARVFEVIRAVQEEPLELMAGCPYSYNRETAKARAVRIARMLRDENVA